MRLPHCVMALMAAMAYLISGESSHSVIYFTRFEAVVGRYMLQPPFTSSHATLSLLTGFSPSHFLPQASRYLSLKATANLPLLEFICEPLTLQEGAI